MSDILTQHVESFVRGRDLDGDAAESLLDAMIHSTDEEALTRLFQGWHRKGISGDEIFLIARIMRDRCTKVTSVHKEFVDIVGTGGSKSKTFNVSTAAAFVAAGARLPVAKHGNKAATSNTGSADVLAELGVEPAVDPATAERCLNEIGVCFMFAPNFHRLSPTLAKVRRGLGFPTIFNCVGPLCNPASAPHQVIGVWDKEVGLQVAMALARLGTTKSWVVHAADGLDEISMGGITFVAEVDGGSVNSFEVATSDFGFDPETLDTIRSDSAVASASMIRQVLNGQAADGTAEKIVAINAAAALFVSGRCESLMAGVTMAQESIRGGAALGKLQRLSEMAGVK